MTAALSKEAMSYFAQKKHEAELRNAFRWKDQPIIKTFDVTSDPRMTMRQAKVLTVEDIYEMYDLLLDERKNKPHVITEMI
jgi:hypothetical protein